MHVLALADALTAALAVVAILLGLLVVARGRRGEGADEQAGQSLLSVPVVVPGTATAAARSGDEADAGEGLQTMAVGEVGHGEIRLGPITRPVPAPAATPAPPAEPLAAAEPGPTPAAEPGPPTPEPGPPVDPPVSWTAHPAPPLPPADPEPVPDRGTAREDAAGESPPQAPEQPPAEDPSPPGPDPPPVPFRQGRIRLRKPSK
jgi:hypothetical protein